MESIAFKIRIIEALWLKLHRTNPNTREYEAILNRIRHLSAEYEALTNVKENPSSCHLARGTAN
jgi:hypothetical protein